MKTLEELIAKWQPARNGFYDGGSFGDTAPSLGILGAKPVSGFASPDGTPLLYEVTYANGTKGYRSDSASDGKTGYTVSGVSPVDMGNGYFDNTMVSSPLDQVRVRGFKDSGSESPFQTVFEMGKQMARDYVLPSMAAYSMANNLGKLANFASPSLDPTGLDSVNSYDVGTQSVYDAMANSQLPAATSGAGLLDGFKLDQSMLDPTNPASGLEAAANEGVLQASKDAAASFADTLAANSYTNPNWFDRTAKWVADNPLKAVQVANGGVAIVNAIDNALSDDNKGGTRSITIPPLTVGTNTGVNTGANTGTNTGTNAPQGLLSSDNMNNPLYLARMKKIKGLLGG